MNKWWRPQFVVKTRSRVDKLTSKYVFASAMKTRRKWKIMLSVNSEKIEKTLNLKKRGNNQGVWTQCYYVRCLCMKWHQYKRWSMHDLQQKHEERWFRWYLQVFDAVYWYPDSVFEPFVWSVSPNQQYSSLSSLKHKTKPYINANSC